MMTWTNILKKATKLLVIGVVACSVLDVNNVWASDCPDECMIPSKITSSNRQKCNSCALNNQNTYIQKGQNGCILTVPFENPNASGVNISSMPGERNGKFHQGMDVGTAGNETLRIVAPAAGTIISETSTYRGGGRVTIMQHPVSANSYMSKDCTTYKTQFLHLYKFLREGCRSGAKVPQGCPIAIVGGSNYKNGRLYDANNASYSTPEDKIHGYNIHMHYEIRNCKDNPSYINPLSDAAQGLCSDVPQEKVNPNDYKTDKGDSHGDKISAYDLAVAKSREATATKASAKSSSTYQDNTGTGAAMEHLQSSYKCNIAENYSILKGCLFCDLFKTIFNTASSVAKICHDTFSKSMITLLVVALAIWIAMQIMKQVSDMTQKDPMKMLNEILRKVFVVAFIIALLNLKVDQFFDIFISPVFDAGFKLASMVMGNTTCDTNWNINGSGLPASMGNNMLCAIYAIQQRLMKLMALGNNAICIACHVYSFLGIPIFPHLGYFITGLALWLISFVFMVVYPFLLIDSVLQFTIASSLFPIALASSAFDMTKKYVNIWKIISTFMNAMFVFIFLTIVLFVLLTGIDSTVVQVIERAYSASGGGDFFSIEAFAWHSKNFIKLVFFLFLGKAVLEDIPNFAGAFASSISMGASTSADIGIGRNVGGLAARAATNFTTQVGGDALSLGAKGYTAVKKVGITAINTARHDYLVNRTKRKLEEAEKNGDTSGVVSGRDWRGRKVSRRLIQNPDGSYALESTRKSLIRGKVSHILEDEHMSIRKKLDKNGKVIGETYKIKSAFGRSLINSDGTRNQVAVNALLQNSSLPQDEINKVILNQMLKQRMPNNNHATLEDKFVSEKITNSVDAQGRKVFEVRRVNAKGDIMVYRMVEGGERDLIEVERITSKGKATKWSSDGILQKKEKCEYELDNNDRIQADNNVYIGDELAEGSFIKADGTVIDKDGNITGQIQQDGHIIDKNNNVIGRANTSNLAFDKKGKVIGKLDSDNIVRDVSGNVVGVISGEGNIIDEKGNVVAQLHQTEDIAHNGFKVKAGSRKVEFSHSKNYKGVEIFDEDGFINDDMTNTELMFDQADLDLYKQQMQQYGDVLQHNSFGR